MKKLFLIAIATLSMSTLHAQVSVHSYTRRDGTFVQGYHRTAPDNNPYNNYSSQGNVNPWTGKEGTVDPVQAKNRQLQKDLAR